MTKLPPRRFSANVFGSRGKVYKRPSAGGKSTQALHRNKSALGPTADQMRNQLTRQDVYLLESNELLTANELFAGLAKIGAEYGRSDASVKDNV